MKSFTDNTGRTWTLAVTVGTIKRVRALCDVDLANIITIDSGTTPKVDLLERLGSDPVLLVDVLYAAVKPEADAKGVTDEEFGRAMSGDAIEMATTALLDEVIDFFPETKRKVFTDGRHRLRGHRGRVRTGAGAGRRRHHRVGDQTAGHTKLGRLPR